MAVFRFRLEKVHKVRQIAEDQARHRLAAAQRELASEKNTLRNMIDHKEEVKIFGVEQNDIALRSYMYRYLAYFNEKIEEQQEKVEKAQQSADSKKEEYLQASKERKVLDRLKEKKLAEFWKEEARKEQYTLDEIGSRRRLS